MRYLSCYELYGVGYKGPFLQNQHFIGFILEKIEKI